MGWPIRKLLPPLPSQEEADSDRRAQEVQQSRLQLEQARARRKVVNAEAELIRVRNQIGSVQ